LPFKNQSVDIILSSWLLFAWIQDEALLIKIFSEFDRVLKPGGKISFYPSQHLSRLKVRYPALSQIWAPYHKQQHFVVGLNPGSLPPAYVTHLHKPR
ncbi:MAG TPA: methyltransferase domain-containing protein, partial [Pseudomonadales bacterium]|nr:methyltransferase domain-containing protein [Pseudomonadales bacterium]